MKRLAIVLLALCASAFGQGLGLINSTRSIDWTHAGLSATFGDGETTVNPWTPPTGRTQCVTTACATVTTNGASSTPAQINAAIASAPQKSYVLLPCGSYNINADLTFIGSANYLTLRGGGPMCVFLNFSGSTTSIDFSVCCNNAQHASLSATSYTVGTTSLTINSATCSATCSNLTVGNIGFIIECDEGFTGTPPYGGFASTCAGSYTDGYPSGATPIMTAARDVGNFNQNNAINGTHAYRQQNVLITSVTNNGGGSYTVGFTPGLYLADWSSNRDAIFWWSNSSDDSFGVGLEDMTVHLVAAGSNEIGFTGACNSWVKGIRLIVGSVNTAFPTSRGCHNLIANNYVDASDPAALLSNISEALTFGDGTTSGGLGDTLFINNIVTDTLCWWGEGNSEGNVSGYNHCLNAQQPDYQTVKLDHFAGRMFDLTDGDYLGRWQSDNTHGNEALNTVARAYINGDDPPFYTQNPGATQLPAYNRFMNFVGNALGGNRSATYQCTAFSQGCIWAIASNNTATGVTDPLDPSSHLRWGNCDVITVGCNFNSAEVPTALTGNASGYSNSLPGSHAIPCSFFIAAYAVAGPCVPKMSGGTGLSWWKVCTSFSSFPNCTGSTIQPFPPVGPELTGGPFVDGFAYDNPAGIAFKTLPIDTSFQSSFTVTASQWSNNGTLCSIAGAGSAPAPYTPCMILTVSLTSIGGNVSAEHIMGGFQLIGAAPGCYPSSGISFTGRADKEIWMTSSSTTQIVYALAADPGANACAVTLKYPDVRQFDESIYQTDSATTYTITISSIVGHGTVTSSDSVLNCTTGTTGTCTDATATGTVTLTETPSAGYTFTGWGGGTCSGSSSTCAVTGAATVTATFTLINGPILNSGKATGTWN